MILKEIDPLIVREYLIRIPASWRMLRSGEDGAAFIRGSVRVIVSLAYESDSNIWIHVSASLANRLPDWEEMKRVKHDFIGPDRHAYQVFPVESEYVNIHPNVLHLWSRLDKQRALPDFTRGSKTI